MGALVGALGGPLLITLAEAWSPRLRLAPLALSWWLVPVVLLPSLGLVRLTHRLRRGGSQRRVDAGVAVGQGAQKVVLGRKLHIGAGRRRAASE